MEPVIADLINNPKVPKWLRFIIVSVIGGLVIFLGIMLMLKSPMIIGRIFGGALATVFAFITAYLFVKIAKSKPNADAGSKDK